LGQLKIGVRAVYDLQLQKGSKPSGAYVLR
jgi:hypothetical protein